MPGGLHILMDEGCQVTLREDSDGTEPERRMCSPHPSGVGGPLKHGKTNVSPVRIGAQEGGMTMSDRLLRRREVEKIAGMSRSTIYRLMQEGEFPRPVKVGSAAVRWRASDITLWLESRPVATGDIGPPNAAWMRPA